MKKSVACIILSIIVVCGWGCASMVPVGDFEPSVLEYEGTGHWVVDTIEDSLSGQQGLMFGLVATSGENSEGNAPILTIAVNSKGESRVLIGWGEYIADATITYRIGQSNPETGRWARTNTKKATYYIDNSLFFANTAKSTEKLIQRILRSEEFVARCTPYLKNTITATFDTKGLYNLAKEYNLWLTE